MVKGIDLFKEFFRDFDRNYIVIGGTACEILEEQAGFKARATKDIDVILVVEALTSDFADRFWQFVKSGKYENNQTSGEGKQYFRFSKPETPGYPKQIEIFSRTPDLIKIPDGTRIVPLPVDKDISSLSAILMDDEYYHFTIANSTIEDGVHIADKKSLICLKAKAFNDLSKRKEEGENIDSYNIKKHKSDIFRISVLLTGEDKIDLPEGMKKDLIDFCRSVKKELPDKAFFREFGLNIDPPVVFDMLCDNFNIKAEL